MHMMLYRVRLAGFEHNCSSGLPVFAEVLLDDLVISQGNALLVDLAITSLCT
jgi:hypothetical protein